MMFAVRAVLLFSILPAITAVCAFSQSQTAATPLSNNVRRRRTRRGEHQTSSYPRLSTELKLAKRRVTPTKKSRQKKKQRSLEYLLELETDIHARGFRYVIGSDDSGGAGCIAGPVVVASCCLMEPFSSFLPIPTPQSSPSSEPIVPQSAMDLLSKVNDCKELTVEQRHDIYDVVQAHPEIFAISVAHRSPNQIDDINLTRATQDAFAESIETLVDKHELPFEEVYAIVDGKVSPKLYASQRVQSNSEEDSAPNIFSVRPYVNGDAHVYTVALASIIARVERDAMMRVLHEEHPLYGFDGHSGYGRRDHIETLHRLGAIDGVHRMSFKQVKGR